MGGEWLFGFLGDPATIDVKKYQQELLKIREKYRYDPAHLENTTWYDITVRQPEPVDNIFVKFTYRCERHKPNYHKQEPGLSSDPRNGWWVLYWDPTKFQKGCNYWGDIHARCRRKDFDDISVTIQRQLAITFPKHFHLYFGDGVDGFGENELYWGVQPEHLGGRGFP